MSIPEITPTDMKKLLALLDRLEREMRPSKLSFVERRTEVTTVRLTKTLSVALQNLAKVNNLSVNSTIEWLVWRACGSRQELLK